MAVRGSRGEPRPMFAARRLNPVVTVVGLECVLVTQYLAVTTVRALGRRVGSLADQADVVKAALDRVFVGF